MEISDKETDQVNLADLSKSYLALREAQWKKDSLWVQSAKREYRGLVESELAKAGKKLFTSEGGILLAKFISLFESGALDRDTIPQITTGLKRNATEFPVIAEVDRAISEFQSRCGSFFVNSGVNYFSKSEAFSLPKIGKSSADIIIETEIKRMKVDQDTRAGGKGPNGSYTTTLTETPASFEVKLDK